MSKESANIENLEPIFIVGMARSGTTLLRSILNSHPNIAIPRETTFYLVEEYLKATKVAAFSKNEVEKFWNWYSEKRRFTYLDLDKKMVEENIDMTNDLEGFKNIFDAVMNTYKNSNNKARWGEKTPGHEEYLEDIFKFYPKAKVIFMIRDPRAIHASMNNVPWNNQFVSVIIKRWNASVVFYNKFKEDVRVKLVTYEELVTDIKPCIKDICEFIGEEFDEKMLTDREKNTLTKTNDGWTTKYEKEVTRKVDNSSIEKWKNDLKKIEIAAIEKYSDQEVFSELYKYTDLNFSINMKLKYNYLKYKYYFNSYIKSNSKK